MNKIYRVIWDRIKHVFIAVSELSNGNKKATYGSNNKKEALKKKTNIGKLSLISLLFLSFAPSYSLASTLLNGANQGTTG